MKNNCLPTYLEKILVIYLKVVSYRLEEVDHQPSINISFLPVPQLIKMNNFFGQYLQEDCFGKPLWSLYP